MEAHGGDGAGGDVEDAGSSSPAILNMLGIISSSLRRRERGGKRAGLQRAMHAAHRAAFALQRHDRRDGAPEILFASDTH